MILFNYAILEAEADADRIDAADKIAQWYATILECPVREAEVDVVASMIEDEMNSRPTTPAPDAIHRAAEKIVDPGS